MTISVLLRLAPEALDDGRLAGSAELIETGARAVVRDVAELVEFIREATDGEATHRTSRGEDSKGGTR